MPPPGKAPYNVASKAWACVVFLHPSIYQVDLVLPAGNGCLVGASEDMQGVFIILVTPGTLAVILPSPSQELPAYSTVSSGVFGEPPLDAQWAPSESSALGLPVNQCPLGIPFLIGIVHSQEAFFPLFPVGLGKGLHHISVHPV